MILRAFEQQENIMIALAYLSWIGSFSEVEILLLILLELVCAPFKRQSCNARIPLKAYSASASYDLYAAETKILKPRTRERQNLN